MAGPIETLRQIARELCAEPADVTTIAQRVGAIVEDYGGGMQIVVKPADAAFREGAVGRSQGTETPSLVELKTAPGGLRLADLRAAFGEARRGPKLHYDSPEEVSFEAPLVRVSPTLSCALIAEVSGEDVVSVTIRRDKL